ncbi:Fc.00g071360.m01.CDS01 [Cosmosporella sp. VM-42]
MRFNTKAVTVTNILGLVIKVNAVDSYQLFDGRQKSLFRNSNLTSACDAALNTNLACPREISMLTYQDFMIGWDIPRLEALCSSDCVVDTAALVSSLQNSCKDDLFTSSQLGNITFAEYAELIEYRTSLLCMRETHEGDFCQLLVDTWDISDSDDWTWPIVSPKCRYDDSGECVPLSSNEYLEWDNEEDVIPSWQFPLDRVQALDYFMNRTGNLEAAKRHSLGSEEWLDYDEYPLEIQCNRCFWKPFAKAQESQWGQMFWDEATEQTWNNIVQNCNLTSDDAIATPFNNITNPNKCEEEDLAFDWEPDWTLCPSNVTITTDYRGTVLAFAQNNSLPMAGLRSLNSHERQNSPAGHTLCLPLTCNTTLVPRLMSVRDFVHKEMANITLSQFLRWNVYLNGESNIITNDTVCNGPRGGFYPFSTATAVSTAIYTATAMPSSHPALESIKNCGVYHIITANDTCPQLSMKYGITFSQMIKMNPTINEECSNLEVGMSYW